MKLHTAFMLGPNSRGGKHYFRSTGITGKIKEQGLLIEYDIPSTNRSSQHKPVTVLTLHTQTLTQDTG